MEVFEAIQSRRSIRSFRADPVRREDIIQILDSARWAPSWKNSQCPRFVVIEDVGIKQGISQTLTRNRSYLSVLTAPLLIVVCAELGKSGHTGCDPATEKGDWYMFDSALAVQNILLSAWSLGLGSVVIGLFDAPAVASITGVPEGFSVVNLIAIGYPDEWPEAPARRPLEQTVSLNRFGDRFTL